MLAGIFHEGSGLGDQLMRYITVRTLAEEKGCEWGMIGNNFKGSAFLSIEVPYTFDTELHLRSIYAPTLVSEWVEKDIRDSNGVDTRSFDPESQFIQGNTIIDGSFEDSKYWGHNLPNIAKWLATKPLEVPDDTCIIGFRGGEYKADSRLFLPKSYYFKGVEIMRQRGVTNFEVHTDDPVTAKEFFPDFKIVDNTTISHSKHSNMGFNWRSVRNAKYAIIPNSAFFILPRILRHHDPFYKKEACCDMCYEKYTVIGDSDRCLNNKCTCHKFPLTIAPRYWARHNQKIWARPACFYKEFTYIHASDTN